MSYIQLTGGSYQSRSLISSAQRSLNLYLEGAPQTTGEPSPYAHLPTPGLTILSQYPYYILIPEAGGSATVRCTYTATNGDLYVVAGQHVFYVDPYWKWNFIGTITPSNPSDATPRNTPVSMADNGTTLIMVDGSIDGWTIDMATRSNFQRITKENNSGLTGYGFYGADRVDCSDTFFILNKPGTPIFYTSGSEAVTFDPLDFASKVAKGDELVTQIVQHRVLWLLGTQSTEIFYNSGGGGSGALSNTNFPYEALPGTFFDRGIVAKYSIAKADNQIFWLSTDLTGNGIVMHGLGYNAQRISTFAIETEFSTYPTLTDVIGFCYQQQGHTFYVLTFPTANKTWCFDSTIQMWHERAAMDGNGHEHRHRANCATFAYGKVICGDYENGSLYHWDIDNYTDAGNPIKRLRSFPHQIDTESNRRVFFKSLIANMQVGTAVSPAQEVVRATFEFPFDGVLVQDYPGLDDIGSNMTQTDFTSGAVIVNNAFVGQGGKTQYQPQGTPLSPDYEFAFQVLPQFYDRFPPIGKNLYAIARADENGNGYKVRITSDGFGYFIDLLPMGYPGLSVAWFLGSLTSGYYQVFGFFVGTSISVRVQRSEDGLWLGPNNTGWVPSTVNCIEIKDDHYTDKGRVLIGGDW